MEGMKCMNGAISQTIARPKNEHSNSPSFPLPFFPLWREFVKAEKFSRKKKGDAPKISKDCYSGR